MSEMAQTAEDTKQVDGVSKQDFRRLVWSHLEKEKIVVFPHPFGRIPNFKGCDKATERLLDIEEFKRGKSIEVNPDKPLEHCRILVLENNKNLYVPLPALHNTFLKHLTLPVDDKHTIKQIVSRWGIENTGKTVDISDEIHIDFLVVGSVAVSKAGYRIGKGKGFADLEFAILKEMHAIDDNTVIATCVHESQVYDTLPIELFKEHDMPVDYILTPTETIKVDPKLPRPHGIIWNLLSQRRINLISVLQKLKLKYESQGIDTTLKAVDTDVETEPRKFKKHKKFTKRRTRILSKTSESETEDEAKSKAHPSVKKRRYVRKPRSKSTNDTTANAAKTANAANTANTANSGKENSAENTENSQLNKPKYRKPSRRLLDFSLMVSNIEKTVRVRDLKNALAERDIKPSGITWRGYKGFCYLHYAKPNANKSQPREPYAVDNVIEILQTLKISPESKSTLCVKVMDPITRIETTDVTAV